MSSGDINLICYLGNKKWVRLSIYLFIQLNISLESE